MRARAPPALQCGAARKRRVRPTALRSAGAGRSAPTRDRGKLQPPTAPPKEPPRSLLQRKALAADAETRHTRWDQEQRGRRLRMVDAPPRTTRSLSSHDRRAAKNNALVVPRRALDANCVATSLATTASALQQRHRRRRRRQAHERDQLFTATPGRGETRASPTRHSRTRRRPLLPARGAALSVECFDYAHTCVCRRLNVDYLDGPVTGAVRP